MSVFIALNPSTSKIKRFSHFAYLRDRADQVYANRRNEKTAFGGRFLRIRYSLELSRIKVTDLFAGQSP